MSLSIETLPLERAIPVRTEIFREIMRKEGMVLFKADPPSFIFAGIVNDIVVGMSEIALFHVDKPLLPKELGEITFYVRPNHRGHRYGEILMDHAMAYIQNILKLPVMGVVSPDSYSEFLFMTRGLEDATERFIGGVNTRNRFYLRE